MHADHSPTHQGDRPDEGTFAQFYQSNFDAVFRYVARRVPPDAHDDVVASTFVTAWRKYQAVSEPSLPWLYRIAHFEVAHEHRRRARQPLMIGLDDLALTDSHPLEEILDLSAAFSHLSERDAELLRLINWEQLSRNEVAEFLGCTVSTVNVRYHRAMGRLAATLQRLSHAPRIANTYDDSPKEK